MSRRNFMTRPVRWPPVAAVTLASLTVSQDGPPFGHHDAGNAVKRITFLAGLEEIDLLDGAGGGSTDAEQEQQFQERFHLEDPVRGSSLVVWALLGIDI